jgi:hypothetical protein
MSFARTQVAFGNNSAGVAASTISATAGSNVPVGHLVVVGVGQATGSTPTWGISDSAGNTYTQLGATYIENTRSLAIFYAVVTVGGTLDITVTSNQSAVMAIGCNDYSFAAGASLTIGTLQTGTNTTGTALTTAGSATWSGNALLFSVAFPHQGPTTAGTGFTTQIGFSTGSAGQTFGTEDWINDTSGSQAFTATQTSSTSWSIIGASFAEVTATPSFTLSPSSIAGSHTTSVTATGTATSWVSGTTYSGSGLAGCSIVTNSVNVGAQTASLSVTTGSTSGTLTVADSTDSAAASLTVTAAGTIAYNDPNIVYPGGTPGNVNGNGASIIMSASGATFPSPDQFIFALDHLVSDTITLNFSTNAANATLVVVVDATTVNTYSINGLSSLSIGTYGVGTHTYTVYISGGNYGYWTSALTAQLFNLTSITTANGSLTVPVTGIATGRGLFIGDSRNAGEAINGASTQDFSISDGPAIADALGCLFGYAVFPGAGVTVYTDGGAVTDIPPWYTASNDAASWWDKLLSGYSRSWAGLDYVVIHGIGVNDSNHTAVGGPTTPAQFTAAIAGVLPLMRAALIAGGSPTCKILWGLSWGGIVGTLNGWTPDVIASAAAAGVASYLASSSDPYTFACPATMSPLFQNFYSNYTYGSSPTRFTADGLHVLIQGGPPVVAASMVGYAAAINPPGGGGYYST